MDRIRLPDGTIQVGVNNEATAGFALNLEGVVAHRAPDRRPVALPFDQNLNIICADVVVVAADLDVSGLTRNGNIVGPDCGGGVDTGGLAADEVVGAVVFAFAGVT